MTVMTEILRTVDAAEIKSRHDELARAGVRSVIGTVVNAAGVTLAKSVPIARLGAFNRSGVGAAPVWHVFCIDGGIAFTDTITAAGDLRLRLDVDALRNLGDGVAWAPANIFAQSGEPSPACARGLLGRVERRLAEAGLRARIGHELEFVLVEPDGSALPDGSWVPYGITGLLDREAFLVDLLDAAAGVGLAIEQVHIEYGRHQVEVSLPPAGPVAAADSVVLTKTLIGRVARKHQLRASFSPVPFAGLVGNGAHQHLSLARERPHDRHSLFSGGSGPHGITDEGCAAIAGILRGLPDVQGVLTGSILSGARLGPGLWSGAYACWGLENREAAVRFLKDGTSNPHGANVEVKIIDPSANPYASSAAVLCLALEGIATRAQLADEVPDDPGRLSEQAGEHAGVRQLPTSPSAIIDALDRSALARRLLGDAIVDTTVAVRRYEQAHHADETPDALAAAFRLAWSC